VRGVVNKFLTGGFLCQRLSSCNVKTRRYRGLVLVFFYKHTPWSGLGRLDVYKHTPWSGLLGLGGLKFKKA